MSKASILDTYASREEANTDKTSLTELLKALDGVSNSIALDECGAYHIKGSHGSIYTWGGSTPAWVMYVVCSSARHWTATKAKLGFLSVTQDASDEGCFKIEELPSKRQATAIRAALGLRKRQKLSEDSQEKRRLRLSRAFLLGE